MIRLSHIDIRVALRLLTAAIVVLILSTFVVAPSVEAATCVQDVVSGTLGPQAAHGPEELLSDLASHEEGGSKTLGGACAHGHCHHQAAPTPAPPAAEDPGLIIHDARYEVVAASSPHSSNLPLPDQPPRA